MPRLFAFSLRLDKSGIFVDILSEESGSFWSISNKLLLTGIKLLS